MTDLSPASARRSPGARSRPPRIDFRRDALFLHIDGTLAPSAPRPEDVGPETRRTAILRRLAEMLSGRLAAVTGRTIADADRILDSACAVVAGVHGLTIRCPDGASRQAPASDAMKVALTDARAFATD